MLQHILRFVLADPREWERVASTCREWRALACDPLVLLPLRWSDTYNDNCEHFSLRFYLFTAWAIDYDRLDWQFDAPHLWKMYTMNTKHRIPIYSVSFLSCAFAVNDWNLVNVLSTRSAIEEKFTHALKAMTDESTTVLHKQTFQSYVEWIFYMMGYNGDDDASASITPRSEFQFDTFPLSTLGINAISTIGHYTRHIAERKPRWRTKPCDKKKKCLSRAQKALGILLRWPQNLCAHYKALRRAFIKQLFEYICNYSMECTAILPILAANLTDDERRTISICFDMDQRYSSRAFLCGSLMGMLQSGLLMRSNTVTNELFFERARNRHNCDIIRALYAYGLRPNAETVREARRNGSILVSLYEHTIGRLWPCNDANLLIRLHEESLI